VRSASRGGKGGGEAKNERPRPEKEGPAKVHEDRNERRASNPGPEKVQKLDINERTGKEDTFARGERGGMDFTGNIDTRGACQADRRTLARRFETYEKENEKKQRGKRRAYRRSSTLRMSTPWKQKKKMRSKSRGGRE